MSEASISHQPPRSGENGLHGDKVTTSKQSDRGVFPAFKMNSENSLVLTSDDLLQATKSGVKTGYLTLDGHISQIPGLSPTICKPPEEKVRGRRAAILESDSDYVKLAKGGGHKGLLWHDEMYSSSPNAYKPPEWFSAESGDANKMGLINSEEEKKSPEDFQPLKQPFGNDNMSTWERDNGNSSGREKKIDHNSQMVDLQTSNPHVSSKFKRIIFDKKPAPVDMSKLLSFGYAEDDRPVQ
ncbi:uncharacterized protein C7orf57 homolog [Menidia menidia]